MEQETVDWVKRGKQKAAVARVLCRPMTVTEIRHACREHAPQIQVRDIWLILKKLTSRGLVTCLTPGLRTGKVFSLTDHGHAMAAAAFDVAAIPMPEDVNWSIYGHLTRARARQAVFLEVCRPDITSNHGKTVSEIKRGLKESHPMTLDAVRRSVKELLRKGLIYESGRTDKRGLRLLKPTETGQRIYTVMTGGSD